MTINIDRLVKDLEDLGKIGFIDGKGANSTHVVIGSSFYEDSNTMRAVRTCDIYRCCWQSDRIFAIHG